MISGGTGGVTVISGVSGSGKSTVGALLAQRLSCTFVDADDLHPSSNVAKMSAGSPLTDDDRWPWLDAVGGAAMAGRAAGVVIACSALRRRYRDRLRSRVPDIVFVQLTARPELLRDRITGRAEHFMPASLLASQLSALEPLGVDESGLTLDVAASPSRLVEDIVNHLSGRNLDSTS